MTHMVISCRCDHLPVGSVLSAHGGVHARFDAWQTTPILARDWADARLTDSIFDIDWMIRGSYGSPRVCHAELRLGGGHPLQPRAGGAAHAPGRR
jgi:hypothetical protein